MTASTGPNRWSRAHPLAPGRGKLRITIRAASVTPIDGKARSGQLRIPLALPTGAGHQGMAPQVTVYPAPAPQAS